MYSVERIFVIVLLIVYCKIDQGIYCPSSEEKSAERSAESGTAEIAAVKSNESNAVKTPVVQSTEANTASKSPVMSVGSAKSILDNIHKKKSEEAARDLEKLTPKKDGSFLILDDLAQYDNIQHSEFEIFAFWRTDSIYWIEVKKFLEACKNENDNNKEVILYTVNVDKDTTISTTVGIKKPIGLVSFYNGKQEQLLEEVRTKQAIYTLFSELIKKKKTDFW